MSISSKPTDDLAAALAQAYPELEAVREQLARERVYLVGGAVRDLLLGRGRADIDLVIEGDAAQFAARFGARVRTHERFATAVVELQEGRIDIATARTELYPKPGALPVVKPSNLSEDLARRDFTINAMAILLGTNPCLIDPQDGRSDLAAGLLRVLHPGSFSDDPSRALRAARYAARFGFSLEPETARWLASADLGTISADRRQAELRRLVAGPEALGGLKLAVQWGLIEPRPGGLELADLVSGLISTSTWADIVDPDQALLAAALGPPGAEAELAALVPGSPSEAVESAREHSSIELLLARALGAEWLDTYLSNWSGVRLEIDGGDLIAAGIDQGPALGRGLQAALRRKLDGEIEGREEELAVALAVAGSQ